MITIEEVNEYKKLAFGVAKSFLKGFPNLREDLKSATLLGLCEALERAKEINHPNPEALIVLRVRHQLVKCLETSYCIIKIPRSHILKKKLEAYINCEEYSIAKLYPEIFSLQEQKIDQGIFYNLEKWQEILWKISEIKLTDFEEKIVIYRLSDYTYKEIGEFLNYTPVGIFKILKRVRKKWLKKIKQ